MSLKQFFVLFCSKNTVNPAVYKTMATINRHLAKNPELKYKTFRAEQEAKEFAESITDKAVAEPSDQQQKLR